MIIEKPKPKPKKKIDSEFQFFLLISEVCLIE